MKNTKKVLIALFLAIVMVFGVAGCNAGAQNDLQSKIDDLQSQIEEMEGRLAEKEEEIRDRNATIEDLNDEIKKRDELNDRLAEMEDEILDRDATIKDLNDEINKLKELESKLAELEDQIVECDETIKDLNEQINKLKEKIEQLEKALAEMQDYVLKISADKQVYRIGEEINIDITLENRSGADVEIAYYFLFVPDSPTGQFPEYEQSPVTTKKTFKNGEIISDTERLGGCFPVGQHQLQFRAIFYLDWEMTEFGWETTSSDVVVWSNTIEFSVIA